MLRIATVTVLVLAALLCGCVRSVNPLYDSDTLERVDGLVGNWVNVEGATWKFEEIVNYDAEYEDAALAAAAESSPIMDTEPLLTDARYRLSIYEPEQGDGVFYAGVVRIGEQYFLDITPDRTGVFDDESRNALYEFLLDPLHMFMKMELAADGTMLSFSLMDPDWLNAYHTSSPIPGYMNGKLTSEPYELRELIATIMDMEGAFGDPLELTRPLQ